MDYTNHTKSISFSNQKCKIQPTLTNLHSNECSQELHYHPFATKLDRCVGSSNALNALNTYLIKYVFQMKQKILIYAFLI